MRVDSVDVGRVLIPSSAGELAEMVREEVGTICMVGAGTELAFGNPLESVDCVVKTDRLGRITQYNPSDLTIHVEAGVPLETFNQALSEHNQMLPFDPFNGGQATIGGLIATNAQGSLRTLGTVRDWIIGMTLVHADGRSTRTGGRVVKNVSGYDLAKLYTGSVGSLAIITEVSFKVRGRWEATATARARLESDSDARDLLAALRAGPLEPVALVWTGPENWIYVRVGEDRSAVRWQMSQLPTAEWEHFDSDGEGPVWEELRAAYHQMPQPVVRVAALPSQVSELIRRFNPVCWVAHAGAGIVLMSLPAGRITELRREFPVVIVRAPIEVRRQVSTFGIREPEYTLMRGIKTAFDPERRLNPGRHVDGEFPL